MKYRSLVLILGPTLLTLLSLRVTAQDCTVCPDGDALRDGDVILSQDTAELYFVTSCGELETNNIFTFADEDTCSSLQISIGVGECGCNPPSGVCTVCPDSTPLVEPARVIDAFAEITCQSWAALAAATDASDPGACDVFHLSAAVCGCPPIQNGCPLCSTGASAADPSATLDFDTEVTCAETEVSIAFVDVDSFYCRITQRAASLYCGCDFVSEDGVCTVCPDGTLVPDPFLVLSGENGDIETCGDLSIFTSFRNDVEDCSDVHIMFSAECGCDPLEDACPLCGDSSVPQNTDGFVVGDEGEATTCQALASFLTVVNRGADMCTSIQAFAADDCGCPPLNLTGACSLCPLGEPVPNPTLVAIFDTSCGNLALAAEQTVTDDCGNFHFAGGFCGCAAPPESKGCTLCAEGTPAPFPDRVVDLGGAGPYGETTCGVFEQQVRFFASDSETCHFSQLSGFLLCSCSGLPPPPDEPICELCANPGNPDAIVPNTDQDARSFTCTEASGIAAFFDDDFDDCREVEQNRAFCGCPDAADCFLCRNGNQPNNPNAIVELQDGTQLTCAELDSRTKSTVIPSNECPAIQNLGVYSCYCDDDPNSCSLCEDGSSLPNPDLEVIPDTSCAALEFLARTASLEECATFRSTAGVYCGCSNPIASIGACRICGDDALLPDSSLSSELDGVTMSCGRAEFDSASEDCGEYQTLFGPFCCQAGTFPPTSSPTMMSPSGGAGRVFTASFTSLGAIVLALFISMVN